MASLPKFYVGDKVRHKHVPSLTGEVVGYSKEILWPGETVPARKVYWKGWDFIDANKVDWTWDFALEAW